MENEVSIIRAKASLEDRRMRGKEIVRKRVAAYCRVSTDGEEQLNSFSSQVKYYTELIEKDPDWMMAGVSILVCSHLPQTTATFCSQTQHPMHVETVVLLSHKKPDGHINVKVEFGEGEGKVPLDNIAKRAEEYKPKERVTYKMIKEYIEAKYGFKVHTAYIAEVKRDLGLPMYDAPNAVEELKQPRKHPTAEKVEAIKDALKHFEVI